MHVQFVFKAGSDYTSNGIQLAPHPTPSADGLVKAPPQASLFPSERAVLLIARGQYLQTAEYAPYTTYYLPHTDGAKLSSCLCISCSAILEGREGT